MLPSLEESRISEEEVIFQQDNNLKHISKKDKNWIEDHNITLLDWPAQSPDLSPIEHLWIHTKDRLKEYSATSKEVWEIWERIVEV